MKPRSRNDDEKLARREAILDAAEEAFLQERFDKTSMDSIAKSAGLSRALLYVYFRDKEDIHLGLCGRASEILFQRMQQYSAQGQTGIEKLNALGRAYVDFYLEDTSQFRILTLACSLASSAIQTEEEITPSQQEFSEHESRIMGLMTECVQLGINDNTTNLAPESDPLSVAMQMRGSLHGVIMLQDVGGSPMFDKANIDRRQWLEQSRARLADSLKKQR
ncbi:TetR/AcrR family transcriptional regulator [Ketobacter sp. MCCC 1A13808]|uniref:TetR/AcrR family transcriptional regulator n=1 Tax=Ketobacter sp. MCCC 1A13808 TaxID=2602738 RepID=UPI000F1917A4|nr:TetR/AcrR family transcriptional regulator [Ketobacter sp. MCCC 1A13808]MVF12176.1 TetR/AcrR family transcriptional regulator [Ketobacter sp. MCCC 1A13808]RLP53718.1 MAG: TetR/AcrR family transcriptional regulator [Ketobacter sp.]